MQSRFPGDSSSSTATLPPSYIFHCLGIIPKEAWARSAQSLVDYIRFAYLFRHSSGRLLFTTFVGK